MKKIFTLIAVALTSVSISAQTESYKPISVAADGTITLAPEFAAIVDESGNATNVADGKSIVTVNTANMTLEAVGGATIANKVNPDDPSANAGQDLVPGTLISEENHTYEIASVGSWNSISWKNGQNKLDINDANGTKLYFLMGTGNPYVKMFCEEVYRDGASTGTYRAQYEYYKPGMQTMPLVGLYYKFTPKVDGTLKVLVWANKGNRNTYVIDDATKQAVPLTAEGYVNGKRANYTTPAIDPETGEQKLDNQGNPIYEQYQIFFNAEQIDSIHTDYIYGNYFRMLQANADAAAAGQEPAYSEEKLAAEKEACDANAETRKYVLSTGNQAFWGWITFKVEAGKSYWLFQDSSQVGFGGFDFTTGDEEQPVGNDLNAIVEAAVPAEGATVVTLNAGEEYTMNAPISKANLTIAGPDGGFAKIKMAEGTSFSPNTNITLKNLEIDASASSDALVTLNASPIEGSINAEGGYYIINDVNIINCKINDAEQIINDNGVKYCVANLLIDNSVISLNANSKKTAIFFSQGFANNLTIKNSTVCSTGADQDYFVRYNNSGRCDRAGFDSNSITYENCTFYNIAKEGQWGNYSGFAGRNTSYWVMTNNIFVDCGNGQVARRYLGGRGDQKTATFANNTYWFNGAAEDTGNYDGTGTALTTDPALKDPANGDFTPTGEAQVAAKTGDPRWFAEDTAVRNFTAETEDANAPVYNLAGQRVAPSTKGILIKNGKKFINR